MGFRSVVLYLKQAVTLLFPLVMGKTKPGKESVSLTQATQTLLHQ